MPDEIQPPMTISPLNKEKTFPKIILILGILILVAGLGFVGWKFFGNKIGLKKNQITLIYWGLFEPESVMQSVIADYEKDHPAVKINYSQQSLTQYRERLQERLLSADQQEKEKNKEVLDLETPDIFRIHQSWVPMFSGLLSEIPVSVYDSTTFEKTFYLSAVESLKLQGKYVGIPLMVDGLALYCNEDLFKAKGLSFPQNWSELKIAAQQLTARDSEGKITTAGAALGTTVNIDHWSDILGLMFFQAGVDPANPGACSQASDGRSVCPGADALQFFANFTTVDRVWDSTLPTSTFAFAKGNLAMYFGPSWRVFDIEGIKNRLQSDFKYKIIPVPQLPMEEEKQIGWSSYWVESVSKKSSYQAEAWEFLKYLSSKEVMQKIFQAQSAVRSFGEPYPRIDMADLVKDHPLVGGYISQAPYSRNWYLSSFTSDNGINDKIIEYFKNAVNEVNQGGDSASSLQTAGQGANQILSQYGLKK